VKLLRVQGANELQNLFVHILWKGLRCLRLLYVTVLYVSSSYSSLDCVLSRWVHFTVHSLDLFVFICVYFVLLFFMLQICQHSGVDLLGLKPSP